MQSRNALISLRGFIDPGDIEIQVKDHADDTAVYVRDIEFVQATTDLLDRFGLASESNISLVKTNVLLCGPLKAARPINTLINYEI